MRNRAQAGVHALVCASVAGARHHAGAGPFSRRLTHAREFRGRILGRLQYLTHAYRRALFGGVRHTRSHLIWMVTRRHTRALMALTAHYLRTSSSLITLSGARHSISTMQLSSKKQSCSSRITCIKMCMPRSRFGCNPAVVSGHRQFNHPDHLFLAIGGDHK